MVTLLPSLSMGQVTKVRGKITDAKTGEPLPFVNIAFLGTTIGAITNDDGDFFLQTRNPSDTLVVMFIGYKKQKVKIKKGAFQEIDFKMIQTEIALETIVVKAGENPAHRIVREIIKHKKQNDPTRITDYQYETYNKMEIDLNNLDEKIKNKKIFKKLEFVFDYVDTSEVTGKEYLPIYFSETLSDYYYQKKPLREKEVVKATKISGIGIDNSDIAKYTGDLYMNANIYENYINLFAKNFLSPIANSGLLSYEYYLLDSGYVDGLYCYHLKFKPRRKHELTFIGEFWVHDTSFAIKRINARIAPTANLNFANDLIVNIEFQRIKDSIWFMRRNEVFVDFRLVEKTSNELDRVGFFARKTTVYSDVKIGNRMPDDFFSRINTTETQITDNADYQDTTYWTNHRPEVLTKNEKKVYLLVDSIRQVPIIKFTEKFGRMFVSGYLNLGNFELGPYFNTYSYNPIEGNRFVISGRTSRELTNKWMTGGYLGYGTLDEEMKFGAYYEKMFKRDPRMAAGITVSHDIRTLGLARKADFILENKLVKTEDNFITSVIRRRYNYKLSMVNSFEAYFEKEWYHGLRNRIYFTFNRMYDADSLKFRLYNDETGLFDGEDLPFLDMAEITLSTRISAREEFLDGHFRRLSLGSDYPIINVNFTYGLKGVFESKYEYMRLNLILKHRINLRVLGWFDYILDIGQIWGDVPFPMLEMHQGNETWAFYKYAYNMLNYYEFASNKYVNFYAENHLNGLILNKIPILRRLHWREVFSWRIMYGQLDEKYQKIMEFPDETKVIDEPYLEAGFGVENIFKLFRVDAVWRLSYRDTPDASTFGIRARMQVRF